MGFGKCVICQAPKGTCKHTSAAVGHQHQLKKAQEKMAEKTAQDLFWAQTLKVPKSALFGQLYGSKSGALASQLNLQQIPKDNVPWEWRVWYVQDGINRTIGIGRGHQDSHLVPPPILFVPEIELLLSSDPRLHLYTRVFEKFGAQALHELAPLLKDMYPHKEGQPTLAVKPCTVPPKPDHSMSFKLTGPGVAVEEGKMTYFNLAFNQLSDDGENKNIDIPKLDQEASEKWVKMEGLWGFDTNEKVELQKADSMSLKQSLKHEYLDPELAKKIGDGTITAEKLGQLAEKLMYGLKIPAEFIHPGTTELTNPGGEVTLVKKRDSEDGEDKVELTISGLTPEEAEALMQKYKSGQKLMAKRPMKEIGTGSKGFLFWEFESSSMTLNGTPIKYVTQLNEDGTLSCNCRGWTQGSAKSPDGRHCKHTDSIKGQYDVADLFKKWKKGLPLGDEFQPMEATPEKAKKLSTTAAPMMAKRVIEL